MIAGRNRRFNPAWFDDYGSWIEYSESKDSAYCLCCFLFRGRNNKGAGYDAFVVKGWNTWNKSDRLKDHVGGIGSVHNQAMKDCENLLKQEQHIDVAMQRSSDAAKFVEEVDTDRTNRDQALGLLVYFQSFDFVFHLQLMLTVLIVTNILSQAL